MRKLLTIAASAVALTGLSVASADTVTFTGTLGMLETGNTAPGATNPVGMGGDMFTITLDYDAGGVNEAVLMIGDASDDAEIIRASVIDVDSGTANANALDMLSIDFVSTEGDLPGNFSIDFEFFNTLLTGESVADALDALRISDNMGAIVCSHFMFNFGGFKFDGTLDEGGITFNPVGEVPVPGAAVLMLSGLAAAGVARRRRQA